MGRRRTGHSGRACEMSFVFTTKPHQPMHLLQPLAQPCFIFRPSGYRTGLKETSLGHTVTETASAADMMAEASRQRRNEKALPLWCPTCTDSSDVCPPAPSCAEAATTSSSLPALSTAASATGRMAAATTGRGTGSREARSHLRPWTGSEVSHSTFFR